MSDTVEQIRVKTKDDVEITVPMKIAEQCGTLRNLMEAVGESGINSQFVIPLPNVSSTDMQLILNWLQRFPPQPAEAAVETRHNSDNKYSGRTTIAPLERRFLEALPTTNALFGMLNSAMYLDIPSISDAGSSYMAEKIKDMSVEEARAYMALPDDLVGWEVDQMRDDLLWMKQEDASQPSSSP